MNNARLARTAITALTATLALTGTAAAKATPATCTNADALPEQTSPAQINTATLCLINNERKTRGLRPLRNQQNLTKAATAYAQEMATKQFFDHVSPTGSTLLTRVKKTNYTRNTRTWALGENIAWANGDYSTPRETVKSWMNSAPHRKNILSQTFTHIGIATAQGGADTTTNPDNTGTTYVNNFGTTKR